MPVVCKVYKTMVQQGLICRHTDHLNSAGAGGRLLLRGGGDLPLHHGRPQVHRQERDPESGLDYFIARYYSSGQYKPKPRTDPPPSAKPKRKVVQQEGGQ
jgi:hypothetical protein